MGLTGLQCMQFSKALRGAFTLPRLKQMCWYRLEKRLDDYALGDDYGEIVFKLIQAAEMEGWTHELLIAARESNPSNSDLLIFSQQFEAASISPSNFKLEKLIIEKNSFLDVNQWYERLGQIESQICRVEIGGYAIGTGFLLGPSALMTNYHVLDTIIEKRGHSAKDVVFRFDYKLLSNGKEFPGTEYRLAKTDWCLDYSPYSQADRQQEPKTATPQPDELDYALVRLEGEPGRDSIGKKPEPEAPKRNWIRIPDKIYDFPPGSILFIFQHPGGKPLKLDFDTVIGLNANRTRVTYKTNTEEGSSGSPCFDRDWDLVAIHHSGDPSVTRPKYNEGIPIRSIMGLLKERKIDHVLAEIEP